MAKNNPATMQTQKPAPLIITRIFNAPVKQVWKAWTDCEVMKKWWGPYGFTSPTCQNDFREGGKYLNAMKGEKDMGEWSGKTAYNTGVYNEITPMKKIVATDSFADEKGNVVPATYYGMSAKFPKEMKLTVNFDEKDGKTKLTLKYEGIPEGKDSEDAKEGWNQSLDKLDKLLATNAPTPQT